MGLKQIVGFALRFDNTAAVFAAPGRAGGSCADKMNSSLRTMADLVRNIAGLGVANERVEALERLYRGGVRVRLQGKERMGYSLWDPKTDERLLIIRPEAEKPDLSTLQVLDPLPCAAELQAPSIPLWGRHLVLNTVEVVRVKTGSRPSLASLGHVVDARNVFETDYKKSRPQTNLPLRLRLVVARGDISRPTQRTLLGPRTDGSLIEPSQVWPRRIPTWIADGPVTHEAMGMRRGLPVPPDPPLSFFPGHLLVRASIGEPYPSFPAGEVISLRPAIEVFS